MKLQTKYFKVLLGTTLIFFSACKDPYTTPENVICYEEKPCILDNACLTILAPRFDVVGTTYEINGETYTVVCNLLLREMINEGADLSKVITTQVTDMSELFMFDNTFNDDISTWDVSNVTNMGSMFKGATSFNQDLSCWDVNNVIDMRGMFDGAATFNQDLANWNVNKVTACGDFDTGAEAWTLQKPNFVKCEP